MTVDVWRAYIYSRALGVSQLDGVCWHTYLTSFLPRRVSLWAKRGLAHFDRLPSTETEMLPVCLYTRCEKHPRKFQAFDTSEMTSLRAIAIYYFRTRCFLARLPIQGDYLAGKWLRDFSKGCWLEWININSKMRFSCWLGNFKSFISLV